MSSKKNTAPAAKSPKAPAAKKTAPAKAPAAKKAAAPAKAPKSKASPKVEQLAPVTTSAGKVETTMRPGTDDAPAGFEGAAPTGTDLETQKGEVEAKVEQASAAVAAKADAPTHRTLTPAEPWSVRGVLALVLAHAPVTTPEVKDAFGKKQQQAYATLRALADAGVIRIGGTEGRRVWERVPGLSDADARAKLDAAKPARASSSGEALVVRHLLAAAAAIRAAHATGQVVNAEHFDLPALASSFETMANHTRTTFAAPLPAAPVAKPAAAPAAPVKASKAAAKKVELGDAVRVNDAHRSDYADLFGDEKQTGLVVAKLDGRFAMVMPAKGGDRVRVNVAHLQHE